MAENYHTILTSAGIRPSVQRVAVYAYLREHQNHPTVETLFSALSPEYPTLSRTTIYNTLRLFEEKHLVQSIQIEDGKTRYDSDMSGHIHFKCIRCGTIFDNFIGEKLYASYAHYDKLLPPGFSMTKVQTNLWGICADCAAASATA